MDIMIEDISRKSLAIEQHMMQETEIAALLKAMDANAYDPQVLMLLAERMRLFTAELLHDAKDYAVHSGRDDIEVSDLRFSIQERQASLVTFMPRPDEILELARNVNRRPLPKIPDQYGVRIPPLEFCLLAPTIEVLPWNEMEDHVEILKRERPGEDFTEGTPIKRRMYRKADRQIRINLSNKNNGDSLPAEKT